MADYEQAVQVLTDLVAIAAEGPAGETDLVDRADRLDPDVAATTLTLAANVIAAERAKAEQLLEHAAATNRTLRQDTVTYRDQATAYATALATILRTTTDDTARETARAVLGPDADGDPDRPTTH